MNINILRKEEHVIEGVVLTFVNIDAQKKAQREIEEMNRAALESTQQFAESIVDTVREALLVLDENFHVISANRRFYKTFKTDPQQAEGKSLFELGDGQWDIPELRRLLTEIMDHDKTFEDYGVTHRFPDIGYKEMLLNGRQLKAEESRKNRILLAIHDVTREGK
jgi:two-component system CheB/CheR fusion protein